jgi:hypothetical protein
MAGCGLELKTGIARRSNDLLPSAATFSTPLQRRQEIVFYFKDNKIPRSFLDGINLTLSARVLGSCRN